jgi:hypothetical protein
MTPMGATWNWPPLCPAKPGLLAAGLWRLSVTVRPSWSCWHSRLAVCGDRTEPHIESESAGHDLHAFQAIRRMDEILLANFMVFHVVVPEEDYDLWIGDEAWELDYYLHENPEQKRAAYAWLTDFVGWLPMPADGEREAFLTADYNAEMIEHIARFPRPVPA